MTDCSWVTCDCLQACRHGNLSVCRFDSQAERLWQACPTEFIDVKQVVTFDQVSLQVPVDLSLVPICFQEMCAIACSICQRWEWGHVLLSSTHSQDGVDAQLLSEDVAVLSGAGSSCSCRVSIRCCDAGKGTGVHTGSGALIM